MFDYLSFIERQLECWPLAKKNHDNLQLVRRRKLMIAGMPVALQYNPGRILSTGADVTSQTISKRPCFLCKSNRPEQQISITGIVDGFEILLNPYPIFPVHFTGSAINHQPQETVPLSAISLLENASDLTVFFNGAKSGASAPDHLHFQAVLKSELPLLRRIEERHFLEIDDMQSGRSESAWSYDVDPDFPFLYRSYIIGKDMTDGIRLLQMFEQDKGCASDNIADPGLINSYIWIDKNGMLRLLSIFRRAHRPDCYGNGENNFLISPGAVDMAGITITPRLCDFETITEEDLIKIYRDVAMPNKPLS